jgi:hypothetical protein
LPVPCGLHTVVERQQKSLIFIGQPQSVPDEPLVLKLGFA